MQIELTDLGKRFRLEWIFRGLAHTFRPGTRTAILGPNGSGKSTLMKVLSGHSSPSSGKIGFVADGKTTDPDHIYRHVSYAAPYIELIEELTLAEAIEFHTRLKPLLPGLSPDDLHALLDLPRARSKELRFFSSGMKQRVKLALAACSDTPVLLLDEPTTNLDLRAVDWYKNLVERFSGPNRTVVIASNDPVDMDFCPEKLDIMAFKQRR
ncbi:MAG: ATP-binding cassette domain-containing protein [Saprospiraceae bacterium]